MIAVPGSSGDAQPTGPTPQMDTPTLHTRNRRGLCVAHSARPTPQPADVCKIDL